MISTNHKYLAILTCVWPSLSSCLLGKLLSLSLPQTTHKLSIILFYIFQQAGLLQKAWL